MHEADKETIHLHAACIILSFAKFSDPFEFLVMLSWSRITYTPLPLAKSSTPEDSMSIPSTLPYSFYAPHSIGISSKFFSKKGMSYEFKKKMMAHESPWKNGHMKVHGSRTWLAMPKIIRRERLYMEHLTLAFPSTTYPRTCTSRSWLYDLFTLLGSIFGFAKYLKQVCLAFLPSISSTLAFLE